MALLLLFVALGVTCVAFGTLTPKPDAGRYPYTGHIVTDRADYANGPIVINGEVTDTAPLTVTSTYTVVRDEQLEHGTATFVVTDTSAQVTASDVVQVYGVLGEDGTISATRVVVTPSRNVSYMYVISAVAGFWVLLRLLQGWRFDRQRFAVVPRDDYPGLGDIVRTLTTETESDA